MDGEQTVGEWQIASEGEEMVLTSEALAFRVQPDLGGTVVAPRWQQRQTMLTPAWFRTNEFHGTAYYRYALNTLREAFSDGETTPLQATASGEWVEIRGEFRASDVVQRGLVRANARTGEMTLDTEIEKTGPGPLKLQVVHEIQYELNEARDGPQIAMTMPVGGREETLYAFEPTESEIMDQDGHSVHRARFLCGPWAEFGEAGSPAALRLTEDDPLVCFALHASVGSGYMLGSLYGTDRVLNRGETTAKRLSIGPCQPARGPRIAVPPVLEPQRREELMDAASSVRRRVAELDVPPAGIQAIRRGQAEWKLKEFGVYMLYSEYAQCAGLLADAQRALEAIDRDEPAVLPEAGETLYETSFRDFPLDWDLFGFCSTQNDPDKGFHLQPVMTTNMWTQQEFDGSYVVQMDFCPTSEHLRGGTFLQMCATCVNPRDPFDFMASATSCMPHYNFGIKCYHYSFNRADLSVCSFRKTGRAFYLLAQIAEPVRERGRWYRLHFVKNHRQFLFLVDGRVVQEYFDEGHQGEVYDRGRVGLRNWGRQSSWFRDFRVVRPKAEAGAAG